MIQEKVTTKHVIPEKVVHVQNNSNFIIVFQNKTFFLNLLWAGAKEIDSNPCQISKFLSLTMFHKLDFPSLPKSLSFKIGNFPSLIEHHQDK